MYPRRHAVERPEHPAMVLAGSAAAIGYRELDERSTRLVGVLREAGLGVDDTVAVLCENRLEWAELVWATQRSGMYVAPISPGLPAGVLTPLLVECGAGAVITSSGYAAEVGKALRALPSVRLRLALGGACGYLDYERALAAASARPLDDERLGSRMMVTSGTTGRPKAIRQPRTDVHPSAAGPQLGRYTELFELDSDTVYLSPSPSYHVAPLRFLLAVQQLGGTVVVMERFDARAALAAIERYRVTHAQFVPTMLHRMVGLPERVRHDHDLSSLRLAITGAAPCSPGLKRRVADWWGPVLHELYGTSESYGSCHIGPADGLARPGSVGRAVFGRIHVTDESGRELPVGRTGQIWFEGSPDFRYLGDEAKSAAARNDRGWTTVGDLGSVDDDGYLYLAGRRDDVIICGGVNVHPAFAERELADHAKVADVCVIGVPDDDLGEVASAVVVPAPGVPPDEQTARELLEHCVARIGRPNSPRTVRFATELPRVETGKLDRKALRA